MRFKTTTPFPLSGFKINNVLFLSGFKIDSVFFFNLFLFLKVLHIKFKKSELNRGLKASKELIVFH